MSMDIQNAIDEFAHREVTKTERERKKDREKDEKFHACTLS